MNTIQSTAQSLSRARSKGASAGLFRAGVLRRLEQIDNGQLRIVDGDEELVFGDSRDAAASPVQIRVHDRSFYRDVALRGSMGAAESFILGHWDSPDLVETLRLFVRNMSMLNGVESGLPRLVSPVLRFGHWLHRNSRKGSRRNIHAHYDLGNDLFRLFLDETMTYSCGYFESADSTMADASRAKLEMICQKLRIGPRDEVVEIGTGWGSFAIHAASRFGCRVTTTTISREQYDLATQRVKAAGLEDRVTILLKDYRDLEGRFDKLVSIEMVEAVGHEYLPTYFAKCSELLKDDGAMLIQAITMPEQSYEQYRRSVDFIRKYIFPGSCVPSVSALNGALAEAEDLRLLGIEDIGLHYAKTLRIWCDEFFRRIDDVRRLGYSEEFIRLWHFYLAYCEAGFAERYIGDVHMLVAKPGWRGDVSDPAALCTRT